MYDLIRTMRANSLRDRLSRYESEKTSLLAEINSSTIGPNRRRDAFIRYSLVLMGMRAINAELNQIEGRQ